MNVLRVIMIFACVVTYNAIGHTQNVRFIHDKYEEALHRAKEEKKLVFVDTYASWCKPCKKQEPVFWDRKLAKYFNEHFVNVKINMDNRVGKELALKHGLVFLPTLMILNPNENVLYRSDQSFSAAVLTAPELLAIAESIATPNRRSYTTTTTTTSNPIVHVTKTKPSNDKNAQLDVEIDESSDGEKILYVLGENENVPPELLKEEAYFRLSLMDGSHRKTAYKYLSTQTDWSTDENMKFLFDFLYTSRSDEFKYLIINRHKFETLLGKEKVEKTVSILVHQTLNRGFPQPDLQEAQALYSYIDPSTSRKEGHKYFLNRLLKEGNTSKFLKMAPDYLEVINNKDHEMMYSFASLSLAENTEKKNIKQSIKLMESAIALGGEQYIYLDFSAQLYFMLGDKTNALLMARKAIAVAKSSQQSYQSIQELLHKIENL